VTGHPRQQGTLARAQRIALSHSVRYAYTGNVHDPAGQSTYCHHRSERVIERDLYRLGAYRLTSHGRLANRRPVSWSRSW
jgi:pyruvate formate lyase activating enzyme